MLAFLFALFSLPPEFDQETVLVKYSTRKLSSNQTKGRKHISFIVLPIGIFTEQWCVWHWTDSYDMVRWTEVFEETVSKLCMVMQNCTKYICDVQKNALIMQILQIL